MRNGVEYGKKDMKSMTSTIFTIHTVHNILIKLTVHRHRFCTSIGC